METPVQIDLQEMKANTRMRDVIAAHIAALEERFGRVTACRVMLKAPNRARTLTTPRSDIRKRASPVALHADVAFAAVLGKARWEGSSFGKGRAPVTQALTVRR